MRKSLLLILLLVILSFGIFPVAYRQVNQEKDAVTFQETVLAGDKRAAEGIGIDCNTHCNYHLFWNTRYTVGETPDIHTDFTFFTTQQQEDWPETYDGLRFDIVGQDSSISLADLSKLDSEALENEGRYGLAKMFLDVAERTPAGEDHSETLYFKDYYEYYPLSVGIDLPGLNLSWMDIRVLAQAGDGLEYENILTAIADFFRIPVDEKQQIEVEIRKNDAGGISGWGLSGGGEILQTLNVVTEYGCYFTFDNRTQDGDLLDTSHIPGGYGIYCLPYEVADGGTVVYAGDLRMVFSIDPEAEVIRFFSSSDDSRLLLLTREDGAYWLTVIDRAAMVRLQKFALLDSEEYRGIWSPYIADDYFVVISGDERFAVVSGTPEDGYTPAFTGDLDGCDGLWTTLDSAAMDFDGEKLTITAKTRIGEEYYGDEGCGFYLAVFDRTGLLYFGEYGSSLDAGNPDDYTDRCRPLYNDPFTVSLPEAAAGSS